ncbi:gas vesicle protein GvpG [Nonomuraea guangzhouensis]|uniref:Gas vesicle protein GvpG n=1 Tax=Nonomuraea guangzhouensis TaxID=1291555 RepID=A0ABW4GTA6_9ACTN|nr:gas vesicle protein GvpG [Nonomuraea guangzhouensis]
MGLIGLVFGWPLAPVKGVIRLGELIQEQAEHELRDPAAVRRRLEEVEQSRAAGLISEEEEAQEMQEALEPLTGGPDEPMTGGPD